jgi:hypothetical protein
VPPKPIVKPAEVLHRDRDGHPGIAPRSRLEATDDRCAGRALRVGVFTVPLLSCRRDAAAFARTGQLHRLRAAAPAKQDNS